MNAPIVSVERFLSRVSVLARDIDIANMSVRPSVCPSVTFRYQMKMAQHIVIVFSPYGSTIILHCGSKKCANFGGL